MRRLIAVKGPLHPRGEKIGGVGHSGCCAAGQTTKTMVYPTGIFEAKSATQDGSITAIIALAAGCINPATRNTGEYENFVTT